MEWLTTPVATVIGSGLTALIGYIASRFARANAPDIVQNDESKKLAVEKDRLNNDAEQALQTGDLTQARKDVAH